MIYDHEALPDVAARDLVRTPLLDDRFQAVLPAAHPLTRRKTELHLRDLRNEPWIGGAPSSAWYQIVRSACRNAGFTPEAAFASDDYIAVQALVAAGLGVSVVPGLATLERLSIYARRSADLDFRFLCANDHLVFRRPWLDGPTALAAVLGASGGMTIATTVALPVIRGPAQTAKMLAALQTLSDGRLLAGVGPGSSVGDYLAAGVPFAERWSRFDEAVRALRGLLGGHQERFRGTFYATEDMDLDPPPGGLPLWIASWGSEVGLRRVAELGDGWLASAYNTTPLTFRQALDRLAAAGKPTATFPHAIATMWFYVTEDPRTADRIIEENLAPLLGRSPEAVRALELPIGSVEECAERINAYTEAGAQRIFIWPLADELPQLEIFRGNVVPRISAAHS